jgi:TIR domain
VRADIGILYAFRADGQIRIYSATGTEWNINLGELCSNHGPTGVVSKIDTPLAISDISSSAHSTNLEHIGELYRSFVGVPILRFGRKLGIVVILTKKMRTYSNDEIEGLQTINMVLAELLFEEATRMKKLWVTYGWKDNETLDVDFILQELRRVGIDTSYDRRKLITGQPLWDQIDQQITNPANSDAWAFVVSKHSLESKPCREELNYALQRALEKRGNTYPLIGIFVEEIDPTIIPSAIRTRLYVNTASSEGLERVRAGVMKEQPNIVYRDVAPYYIKLHRSQSAYPLIVEARPRTGTWNPCVALVPLAEKGVLYGVLVRANGKVPRMSVMSFVEGGWPGGELWSSGPADTEAATPTMSMYVFLKSVPTRLLVGPTDGPIEVDLSAAT